MFNNIFNTKRILARERHPWIDYARGISIILVSYRHVFEGLKTTETAAEFPVLNYLNIFFFSFRMPLFFIVSGLFLGYSLRRSGLGGFVRSRCETLLYPLIIWGTLHISLQLLFAGYVNAHREPSDYFRLLYDPRKIEQFWYLNALFFVGILYAALTVWAKFNKMLHLLLGLFLFSVAGWMYSQGIDPGFLKDVFYFYIFFAAGDALSDFLLDPARTRVFSSPKLILILLPVFILLQVNFSALNLDKGDDYFVQNQRPYLFALTAFFGGFFVICVSFLLQEKKWLPLLRVIGYHSLYIYVANLMATAATRILLRRVLHVEEMYVLLIVGTLAGIFLPMLLYSLANRWGAWWLYTLRKPSYSGKSNTEKDAAPVIPVLAKQTTKEETV